MKIFRISNLLLLGFAAILGTLLFWTSQAVQVRENELADVEAAAGAEEESIRVLSAEWDYLNRPQRLEALAKGTLKMVPPGGAEGMAHDVSDIPEPSMPVMPGVKPGHTQQVSTAKEEAPAPKMERENFSALLKKLDTEAGQ